MALREVRLIQTVRPFGYRSPFPDQEHTLLVCVVDRSVTDAERQKLSEEIVAARCRYAVCWGHECSSWDTSIDCACIEAAEDFNPPDEDFIVTTWHDKESIEDTLEFWWMNTWFDDYESTRFGVLVIGDDPELVKRIQCITTEMTDHWNSQEAEP